MPKWIVPLIVILSTLALLPAALIFFARSTNSPVPRISIIPDMDTQQKFKTQTYNNLFADHRASRLPVAGTVAYGETLLDSHFYRGIVNGDWAVSMPMPVTEPMMQRGQQRFAIYCAPCHGLDGSGNGPVAVRAEQLAEGTWVPPLNFNNAAVVARPVGHLFNTVTNGIRNMPAYGAQIPPDDRWAIVAYVKALQRSQHGTLRDVTPEERQLLEQQQAAQAAAGAPAGAAAATAGGGASGTGAGDQTAQQRTGGGK